MSEPKLFELFKPLLELFELLFEPLFELLFEPLILPCFQHGRLAFCLLV